MVGNIVKKGLSAFVSKQTNIFSAALFIVLTTIFSQVLGFLKYRLLVSLFGASSDLGVLFAAFRVPDFIFQVVIAGVISSSFIPLFSEFLSRDKKNEAFAFTSHIANIGIVFYLVVTLIVFVFADLIASLIAPGFTEAEIAKMADLMRIIQISQLFFMLGTIATATLQSFQHFLIPGIATAFYNFGIIMGIIIFAPLLGIVGATFGVMIGSFLFFAVQVPLLRMNGFRYFPEIRFTKEIRKLLNLMVPRSLTFVVTQIAITANVFFASFISARSLVIFDLAQTLVMAPVLLFGQSIAQASFPALSLKTENKKEFVNIFTSSFTQILYLTMPVSALLIVLRIPVVRLFYGASRFDWQATVDTGLTLAYFSLSIAAQALIYLCARAFYAYKDTKTPLLITTISVIMNIGFSAYFVLENNLPIYFLAISFSLSTIVSFLLMLIFINRKIDLPKLEIIISGSKILIATLIMGVALYTPIKLLDQLVFDTTRTINLLALTSIASFFGLASYLFVTWLLDIREAYFILQVVRRFGSRKRILKNIGELIDGSRINP